MTSATTWDELAITGEGGVVYYLEIHGLGVFGTVDNTPGDSWYVSNGYSAYTKFYPWLQFVDLGPVREEINFLEANLSVSKITARIADIGGGFTNLLKSWRSWQHTWITSTISSTGTQIPVRNAFSTSDNLFYLGGEACAYQSINSTATQYNNVSRGLFRTYKSQHDCDIAAEPPVQPVVTSGPHSLVGRRATIHAAVVAADGTVGATTTVYRGRITKGMKAGRGEWEIPIEHIWEGTKAMVADNMPSTTILSHQYYFSGSTEKVSRSTFSMGISDFGGGGNEWADITVDNKTYNIGSLMSELEDKIHDSSLTISVQITLNDDGIVQVVFRQLTDHQPVIVVMDHDPFWCLGFAQGAIYGVTGQESTVAAPNPPRLLCIEVNPWLEVDSPLKILVQDNTKFTAGLFVQVPGMPAIQVDSVSATNTSRIDLTPAAYDYRWQSGHFYLAVEDEVESMVLRHVFTTGLIWPYANSTLRAALELYLHTYTNQIEPQSWCPYGFTDDDFDWDEFDEAIATVPPQLNRWHSVLVEGKPIWKVIGPAMATLAICPRITDDGKIGFVRLQTPVLTMASSVELNDEIWGLVRASEVESSLDDSPILNLVKLKMTQDYRSKESKPEFIAVPEKIYWREGLETIFRTRSISYEIPGWLSGDYNSYWIPHGELMDSIIGELMATHFGIFGREAATVEIPCTWTSRQLKCGDYVKVTHEVLPDTVEGNIGVDERIGLVVGRRTSMTAGTDMLYVRFGPIIYSGAIAPCALGTAYNSTSAILTFSSAASTQYEQIGVDDLTRFERSTGTVEVVLQSYDNAAPSIYPATIVSGGVNVSSGTVEFTSDPFSGGGMPTDGVWMTLGDWDDAATWQRVYAYSGDTTPTLGSADDDPMEWTI